jgi:hypothetical protein
MSKSTAHFCELTCTLTCMHACPCGAVLVAVAYFISSPGLDTPVTILSTTPFDTFTNGVMWKT